MNYILKNVSNFFCCDVKERLPGSGKITFNYFITRSKITNDFLDTNKILN